MKVLAIKFFALLAVVASRNIDFEDVIDLEENTAYGYHMKYGIPLANKIRETEARGESARIVGGTAARLGDIPYQVVLIITLTNNKQSVCGGSILSTRRVLTAAHCWFDGQNRGKQYTAVAGSLTLFSGGQRRTGSSVIVHAHWNPSRSIKDLAMINLGSVFSFNNNVKSIALPFANETNLSFAGSTGTVTGYGRTGDTGGIPQNTVLRSVSAPVITNFVCQQSFKAVTASHICTRGPAGRSTCPGDSGGPLVVTNSNRRILVGVVSFGANRCTAGHPVAYTRVRSYRNWITTRL